MAHPEQREFLTNVKTKFPAFFDRMKVLEVGSLNINGTVRDFFTNCDYTGIDVGEGPGVDIISSGHTFEAPNDTYDVSISCECFEHNPHWVETFINMHRMAKNNGFVIMSCATDGRPEHGTTRTSPRDSPLTISAGWEYYKNLSVKDFEDNFSINSLFSQHQFIVDHRHHDLYFWGIVTKGE